MTKASSQNDSFNVLAGVPGAAPGLGVPASAVVNTEQVRAELLAWAPEGVGPGKTVWVGLQLAHQPEWHSYWKNPGDSGLPTTLTWSLPTGVVAGDIAWPAPQKLPIGTLVNYGYENTVLLPVPLHISRAFVPGADNMLRLKLQAHWLVCRKECIPQEGVFTLLLPLNKSAASHGPVFEASFKAMPQPLPPASSRVTLKDGAMELSLDGLPAGLRGKTLDFFPEIAQLIEPSATGSQAWEGGRWTARFPLSRQRTESPKSLPMVLRWSGEAPGQTTRADQSAHGAQAFRLDVPVTGEWPAVAAAAPVPPALAAALEANAANAANARNAGNAGRSTQGATASLGTAAPGSLIAALLGALIGGLMLNLMPCVFPVLAIKVVGFAQLKDPATRVATGLAYTLGVVLSFLALGGLLLGLRAAGEHLGWGFQLQNPAVVAALAALFTLIGLNLMGLFDIGQLLPSRLANLRANHPTTDAFLSGVLAVAIASPCTAPFMGASLGYAVVLPAAQALAVFAAIGLGMALPYLAVSLVPALGRALPRPGPWMVTFRRLMAFAMLGTVVWLVWVIGQQSGVDGAGALLGLLLLLALLVWTLTLSGRTRQVLATLSGLLLALGLWALGPHITASPEAAAGPTTAATTSTATSTERWQPWAPGRVAELSAAGQSVMVDFTAAWCVTCQVNKKTTLSHPDVLADFAAKKVALLRADWTRGDPAITAALAQLGRSGVPVYVIYHPGRAPVVLSELLTVQQVRAELAKL